jgi:IS605 OrfB family transposase
MKCVDSAFRSFFALLKLVEKKQYSRDAVRIPHYLPKDGLYPIHLPESFMKEDGTMTIPMSPLLKKQTDTRIVLHFPPQIRNKKVHQIHIIPKQGGKWFEARYLFDEDDIEIPLDLDSTKALGIDLGVDNFATCATSDGNAFIIDGRMLKSQNQWYNKERARLSSIKDCQNISGDTFRIGKLTEKRNRQVDYLVYCASKYIVNYCISHRIANIVVGYNEGFQDSPKMKKKTKQSFCSLPYGKFKQRLKFLCVRYNLNYVEQEESYTSKASFFEQDFMPVWNPLNPKQGSFSGNRIHRGLYKRYNDITLNADVNGALNIIRKSKLNQIKHLEQCRGEVITPLRIRLS